MSPAPKGTTIDRARLLGELDKATTTFGDDSGTWVSVGDLASVLWVDYGRVSGELRALADDGLAHRHPSGADYWQRLPQARA